VAKCILSELFLGVIYDIFASWLYLCLSYFCKITHPVANVYIFSCTTDVQCCPSIVQLISNVLTFAFGMYCNVKVFCSVALYDIK
jgi:hypothetical protein